MSLISQIQAKKSYLCVGLDTDAAKIPSFLRSKKDGILLFNKHIIDATKDYTVAYKINTAFYECLGKEGWDIMEETLSYIPKDIFTIADAKRGDIDNTSRMYARTFFERYHFDSITVAPYMGEDSVKPFLEYAGKTVFLLALTSNKGGKDFQYMREGGKTLYQKVIEKGQKWAEDMPGNLGFVVGATRAEYVAEIRALAPNACFLVPGVGAQGGDLHAVCEAGKTDLGGLLINASRSILYASNDENFSENAKIEARNLWREMQKYFI